MYQDAAQLSKSWKVAKHVLIVRLSIEEIKIVIMGLKKRLKKAKTEKTHQQVSA